VDAIRGGECSKVVLARRRTFPLLYTPPGVEGGARARAAQIDKKVSAAPGSKRGANFLVCLCLESGEAFISCTPERLFRVDGCSIHTEAIAGTVKIVAGQKAEAERFLLSSQKDREEHEYVVEYIQSALNSCGYLSVETRGPTLMCLPHLAHLQTTFVGTRDRRTPIPQLLKKLHPTPAVCGLPLDAAVSKIHELEDFDRGFYAGPFGWFNATGGDFAVAIRSALIHNDNIHVYGGCGIVRQSDAESEYAETNLKMSTYTNLFHFSHAQATTHALPSLPNINAVHAFATIEELSRCGVQHFFLAPGSRSSPLAVAIVRSLRARYTVCHDERGAAFLALGYVRSRRAPAAVLTSSGTATANLFPAVVEAAQEALPMVVLTADRPPELRDSGANQAIDQVKMFGGYVRWFKDVPCPTDKVSVRNVLSDADYAYACAVGVMGGDPGPVHLNLMFREKLAPTEEEWSRSCIEGLQSWSKTSAPFTQFSRVAVDLESLDLSNVQLKSDLAALVHVLSKSHRGVIIAGDLRTPDDRHAVSRLAQLLRWPILPDATSGIRFGGLKSDAPVVSYVDQMLLANGFRRRVEEYDFALQFGARLVSKRLLALVSESDRTRFDSGVLARVLVHWDGVRHDQDFSYSHRFRASASSFVTVLENILRQEEVTVSESALFSLHEMSEGNDRFVRELLLEDGVVTEPIAARMVCEELPWYCDLFVSNSMPIRDINMFGPAALDRNLTILCNRGASGIDGILSTVIGFSIASRRRICLLTGDMSFLHDLNALHLLSSSEQPRAASAIPPLLIILINNRGGGIFQFLPIASHPDTLSPAFTSPHDADFPRIAAAFGLACESVPERAPPAALREALRSAMRCERHAVVEVRTHREENVGLHRRLGAAIAVEVERAMEEMFPHEE